MNKLLMSQGDVDKNIEQMLLVGSKTHFCARFPNRSLCTVTTERLIRKWCRNKHVTHQDLHMFSVCCSDKWLFLCLFQAWPSGWRHGSRSNQQILLGCDWKIAGMSGSLIYMETKLATAWQHACNSMEHHSNCIVTFELPTEQHSNYMKKP